MNIDVCIIGGGPVGIYTTFQAGMLGMNSCVIDSLSFLGGQCSALYPEKPIFDIPSHKKITGQDLINALIDQASSFNPKYILNSKATNLRGDSENGFEIDVENNDTNTTQTIYAKVVVIASGSGFFGPKRPPLENIDKFEGKQIMYFVDKISRFENKNVLIAGGGDSAVDWAISLSEVAKKVSIIHRRPHFRCLPESEKQLQTLVESGKVNLLTPFQLSGIIEKDDKITGIEVENIDNENRKIIDCDYLLPFFGLNADIGNIEKWGIDLHKKTINISQHNSETNKKGVYAVGDIAHYEGKLKLIMLGFSESALAMHNAYSIVFKGKSLHFEHSSSKGDLVK